VTELHQVQFQFPNFD